MRRFEFKALAVSVMVFGCAQGVAAQSPALQGGAATVAMAPRLHFSPDEMALAEAVASHPSLAAFYGANELKPIFTGPEGETLRKALRDTISAMPAHGIPASRYRPQALAGAGQDFAAEMLHARILARLIRDLTGGMIDPAEVPGIHREVTRPSIAKLMNEFAAHDDPAGFLAGLAPQNRAYKALQAVLRERTSLTPSADLPKAPEAVWRVGMQGEGVLPLRRRLASIGFDAAATQPRLYDEALSQAVSRYQEAVGLRPDGVAGPNTIRRLNSDGADTRSRAVLVALERMRWMGGEDLEDRLVWVNIPEFTARIMENDEEVFRTRAVVGKTASDMQTPEFSDQMEYVVVNPRWNVPRSITVKEYLPKLKANRHAVSHLDVIDGNGNVVPRDNIDFARYTESSFPYRMRQKPSGDNALGLVKFIFPNRWNIYLHDTPTKYLFAKQQRAYSHGCVRIGDPFDLAYQLLSSQSSDPRAVFHRALDSGRETWLHLKPNVPVHLVYFTAFPDETGQIRYFNDIYGRDAAIWARMEQAGLDLGA